MIQRFDPDQFLKKKMECQSLSDFVIYLAHSNFSSEFTKDIVGFSNVITNAHKLKPKNVLVSLHVHKFNPAFTLKHTYVHLGYAIV